MIYSSDIHYSIFNIILAKILCIKTIKIVVEWYDKSSVISASQLKIIKWWFYIFNLKYINQFNDGLIVVSNFLKDYFISKNFPEDKLLLVPNLVDLSDFEVNNHISPANKNIRIGYCGTPTRKDGILDLFSAFNFVNQRYPNTELLIIGDWMGGKSYIPELQRQAKKMHIFENTIFTGLVDKKEIPELLNSCDILVLARPSGIFAEAGFPTKLGEYMACKKPVVLTKVGDIPLYLKDGFNAMVAEPDNPQSVGEKIAILIGNPIRAKQIGEEGYNWVKSTLQYTTIAKKVELFIDRL